MPDQEAVSPALSPQTLAEMEAGRKAAAANAAAFSAAEKARAAEAAAKQDQTVTKVSEAEADAAVAEAIAAKGEVFPVAKGEQQYQPNQRKNR